MGALFRTWLRASVLKKGGSSPMWTMIGVLSLLNELRKRYAGKPAPVTILSDGIRPGEVIEIRHTGKPSKQVRKQRATKAALLAQFAAVDQPGVRRRKAKRMRSLLDGTMVSEMASGATATATATPVLQLLETATAALPASRALTKRGRRKAAKAARKYAKRAAK